MIDWLFGFVVGVACGFFGTAALWQRLTDTTKPDRAETLGRTDHENRRPRRTMWD